MAKTIKVLNLYAGIGGNRKLWPNAEIEVTAVELNPAIAKIYQDFFPDDTVIVGDAHLYLRVHYKEFDFIWSSPPCPTHSKLGMCRVFSDSKITGAYKSEARYPDMKLYQEIILLSYFFRGKYCIENVESFYEPLITPRKIHRHYFWSNFNIPMIKLSGVDIEKGNINELQNNCGFDISKYKLNCKRETVLRNCVNSKLGLHIFKCAFKETQATLIHK